MKEALKSLRAIQRKLAERNCLTPEERSDMMLGVRQNHIREEKALETFYLRVDGLHWKEIGQIVGGHSAQHARNLGRAGAWRMRRIMGREIFQARFPKWERLFHDYIQY
jgi:hypothetical protein